MTALIAPIVAVIASWPVKTLAQNQSVQCVNGTPYPPNDPVTCVPIGRNAPWGGVHTLGGAVEIILYIGLAVVGFIAVVFVILGGYKYMTSGGNEEQLKGAKKTITDALIGVVLVLISLALVRIVANLVQGTV